MPNPYSPPQAAGSPRFARIEEDGPIQRYRSLNRVCCRAIGAISLLLFVMHFAMAIVILAERDDEVPWRTVSWLFAIALGLFAGGCLSLLGSLWGTSLSAIASAPMLAELAREAANASSQPSIPPGSIQIAYAAGALPGVLIVAFAAIALLTGLAIRRRRGTLM
jgi:hypothetical protein